MYTLGPQQSMWAECNGIRSLQLNADRRIMYLEQTNAMTVIYHG